MTWNKPPDEERRTVNFCQYPSLVAAFKKACAAQGLDHNKQIEQLMIKIVRRKVQ